MRRREQPQAAEEDPWGDEEDVAGARAQGVHPPQRSAATKAPLQQSRLQRPLAHQPFGPAAAPAKVAPREERPPGPPTLHAICLGVLGEHLADLLRDPECQQEVLPMLPGEVKACLLALARLRAMLCDAALLLLADQGHTILDLHGCGELVSDAGIRAALPLMPNLRLVDLSSCAVGPATLRVLGQSCPRLEVLRLGSPATDASAGRALPDILPVLEQRHETPAAESWDALLEVEDAQELAAAVAGTGRLMQLQSLCWPNIPFRAEEHCRAACPRVALNPTPQDVAARRLPAAADPSLQLDAPLLAEVANSERWARSANRAEEGPPVMHIAERFRLAYLSREQRVRAKMERNWQQQRRRELRQRSAGEALIQQWESEM